MNKKFCSIAFIVAIYVSGVFVISLQSEAMIKQEFSKQQKIVNINHGVNLSDIDYQRGLFTSTARFTLTVDQGSENMISFENNVAIQHGPVMMTRQGLKLALFNADSRLVSNNFSKITAINDMAEVVKLKLMDYFSNDFAISTLTVGFTGHANYMLTIAPLKIKQQTAQFNFEGMVAHGEGSFTQP